MYSWLIIYCCTSIKYLATFITVLNSSFCQFIDYQNAYANWLTESFVALNSLVTFTPVGKELS